MSAATAGSAVEGRSATIPRPSTPFAKANSAQGDKTTAYGYVYDDPSGQPLRGVPVHLTAWIGCTKTSRTTRTCPPYLPYTAVTNTQGRFELRGVPNGRYLLVIGNDDALDFVRPTIHDQVFFDGGTQRVVAPTLPREPQPTPPYPSPRPVRVPAVERSGNYRLTTLDVKREFPCLDAFNHTRAGKGFPAMVLDEWLTENVRAIEAYAKTIAPRTKHIYQTAAIFDGTSAAGGTRCASALVAPGFAAGSARKLALDPRSLWYGGEYLPPGTPGQPGKAHGTQLFGIDPRAYQNPAKPPWP